MREALKTILKFKAGREITLVSPITLTNGFKKAPGDIEMTKVLCDGYLLVKCKSAAQRNEAMKLQIVCKKEVVEKRLVGEERGARRVITGIPIGENLDEWTKVMKEGTVMGIRWL